MKKNINLIMGMLLLVILGVASCSDEFNENEFIEKQADLAESKAQADHQRALDIIQAQLTATLAAIQAEGDAALELAALQALMAEELEKLKASLQREEDSLRAANFLAAYRAAGLLTEFTVVANDESGQPLADVTVTVSSVADPVVTGADGNAVFQDVIVGNNLLNLSSDAILNFQATVRFNRLQTSTFGTTTVVLPQTANLSLNLFATISSNEDLGTVAGTVTIETDLTNDAPEFPAAGIVTADLTDFMVESNVITNEENLNISNLSFTEGDLGVGVIDTTNGNYELKVPVPSNGANIRLNFPEIEANQTLAIASRDGSEIPAEIADVPAIFNLNNSSDPVPAVRNYDFVVNDPAPAGSGFAIDFSPRPSLLPSFSVNAQSDRNIFAEGIFRSGNLDTRGNFTLAITSTGNGYDSSPFLVDNDQDTIGFGYLEGVINGVGIVNGGTVASNSSFPITVRKHQSFGFTNPQVGTASSDASGKITKVELFSDAVNLNIGNIQLDSLEVRVFGEPSVELSGSFDLTLNGLRLNPNDDTYTADPSLSFVGGGATTQATISTDIDFYYDLSIANAGTGYTVLPSTMEISGKRRTGVTSITDVDDFLVREELRGTFTDTKFFRDAFKLDGNGGIAFKNVKASIFTRFAFISEPNPKLIEAERYPLNPSNAFVNNAGELFLNLNRFDVRQAGQPYNEERTLSVVERIAGFGGTGFAVEFNETLRADGIYTLDGVNELNRGEGYSNNINRSSQGANGSTFIVVRRGQTTRANANYGTGRRLEVVGGDN